MTRLTEAAVMSFWRWFSSIAQKFSSNLEDEGILRELDDRIRSFGDLAWEVGPGLGKSNALVISPAGAPELLHLTEEVVKYAPALPEWEFHSAKPPKAWSLRFTLEGVDGASIDIDARSWEYVLFRDPDGKLDVLVHAPDLETVAEDLRLTAAEIAVEGVVGERVRLGRVGEIEVATHLDEELRDRATSLEELAAHVRSLSP